MRRWLLRLLLAPLLVLAGCASGPPPPDWQLAARGALDQALAADLRGDARIAALEFERALAAIRRTGRPALVARAELLRCAARVAALDFAPCAGFERLRVDAAAPELAYADHLAGRLAPADLPLLPPAQQAVAALVAAPDDGAAAARLQTVADPLSRLVGAALLRQAGAAGPAVIGVAVHTAADQGWQRPLLAWLVLQHQRAALAGDAAGAAQVQRRIALLGGSR